MQATSWAAFKRCDQTQQKLTNQTVVTYQVISQFNLANDYKQRLYNLHRSPVNDLIGFNKDGRQSIICKDMSEQAESFKHLIPLVHTQKSCLALPFIVERIKPKIIDNTENNDNFRTEIFALFLFHFRIDYFDLNDLQFVQMALLLIESLLKRQTLTEDLRSIMPSVIQGTMAAQIAHEIKNPCAPMVSTVQTLLITFSGNTDALKQVFNANNFVEDTIKMLETCKVSLQRIQRNTNNLMHFSNLRKANPESVKLSAIIKELIDYHWYDDSEKNSTILVHKIQIIEEIDNAIESCLVNLDPFHLKMALINLINNAVYAIHKENAQKKTGQIILRLKQLNDVAFPIALEIEDNGPGMHLSVKNQLFEPFFTTKASDGHGLGCTISKVMIEQFGGTISVNSVIDSGSTFTIKLPQHVIIKSTEEKKND